MRPANTRAASAKPAGTTGAGNAGRIPGTVCRLRSRDGARSEGVRCTKSGNSQEPKGAAEAWCPAGAGEAAR